MSSYLNYVGVSVHGLMLAAASKKTSSASSELILFAFLGLIVYFLVLRPRGQRQKRMQQQKQAASIGDEVMLTSGIIGRVTSIDGDRASIEIAPEIEVEVVSRAIGQVLSTADADLSVDVPPDPGADDTDDEHDVYDQHDGDDQEAYDQHDGDDQVEHENEEHEGDEHDDNGPPGVGGSSHGVDGLGVDERKS